MISEHVPFDFQPIDNTQTFTHSNMHISMDGGVCE